MHKYKDAILQEISDDLKLEENNEETKGIIVPLLSKALKKLNDRKFIF